MNGLHSSIRTALAAVLAVAGSWAFTAPVLADLPLTQPGPDAAQLVGRPGKPGSDLYRVQFIAIDGRTIVGDREILWVEPGKYEITVRAIIKRPGGLSFKQPNYRPEDDYNKIELVVEAGKDYHILAKYDRSERSRVNYNTVLYKVEDRD